LWIPFGIIKDPLGSPTVRSQITLMGNKPPVTGVPILIDGDILAYRAASVLGWTEGTVSNTPIHAKMSMVGGVLEPIISSIFENTQVLSLEEEFYGTRLKSSTGEFFLTGSTNFRNQIAKTHVYKGHRSSSAKPLALVYCRDYLCSYYGAITSVDEEADDLISKRSHELDYQCVVVSVDKDFLQLPCWHFNTMHNSWTKLSPQEATKFFYTQILTGDVADNIKGLHRVGPVKAASILEGATTEWDMYCRVREAYGEDQQDYLVENARLLWLRRGEGQIWQPPINTEVG